MGGVAAFYMATTCRSLPPRVSGCGLAGFEQNGHVGQRVPVEIGAQRGQRGHACARAVGVDKPQAQAVGRRLHDLEAVHARRILDDRGQRERNQLHACRRRARATR